MRFPIFQPGLILLFSCDFNAKMTYIIENVKGKSRFTRFFPGLF